MLCLDQSHRAVVLQGRATTVRMHVLVVQVAWNRERLQLIQVARKNLDPRAQSAADGGQKG